MAGRPRVPSAIKRLKGTDQPCRMNPDEPEPPRGNIHCPSHLDKIAKREWRRLELILSAMRVLTDADYVTLAELCQQLSIWERASRQVEREGMLVNHLRGSRKLIGKGPDGQDVVENLTEIRRHPGLKVMNDALGLINKCCSELGLTPAARTKVKTVDARKGEQNPWKQIEQPRQTTQSQIQ